MGCIKFLDLFFEGVRICPPAVGRKEESSSDDDASEQQNQLKRHTFMSRKASAEITVSLAIDVDGAPNAYGPDDSKALDYKLNARVGAKPTGKIVGYRTKTVGGKQVPIVQGSADPS